jgi:hypothetical protein
LKERIQIVRKTFVLLVAAAGMALGAPVITVFPSVGPSSLAGSAAAYDQNALEALWDGLPSFSTFGGPASAYSQVSGPIPANQIVDTFGVFNSWLGFAGPAAPFNQEFGNNLYFGVQILGGTTSFSLSQLVYTDNLSTYDPSLAGTTPFSFNGDNYDSRFLAYLDDGAIVGVLDTTDTAVAVNTAGSTAVNYLFYRGVPTFFLPIAGATNQQSLDNTIAAISSNGPISLTASYCLAATPGSLTCGQSTGTATAVVGTGSDIPEPSTYGLMGLGLAALAYIRRRLA